jgi:hypothetical protein
MGDAPAFMIKGLAHALLMGEGMGDASAFVIKGDVPQATCVFFAFIIGDAHYECMSSVCQRSVCVSDINLNETHCFST